MPIHHYKDLEKYTPNSLTPKEINNQIPVYTGKKKGIVYIFNHVNYEKELVRLEERKGSQADVDSLNYLLLKLGFEIKRPKNPKTPNEVFEDYTLDAILKELEEAKDDDYQSIGVIVMSHGLLHKIAAKCELYDEKILYDALSRKFKDKLKFFIFQVCRDNYSDVKGKQLLSLPEVDMLVLHSAYPENESIRNTEFGTYLIQILCKRLSIIREECCFLDEMNFVKRDVGDWTCGYQMPMISHSMTKRFTIGPCEGE